MFYLHIFPYNVFDNANLNQVRIILKIHLIIIGIDPMFSAFVATRKKYMEKVNKSVRHGKQKQSEEKARHRKGR